MGIKIFQHTVKHSIKEDNYETIVYREVGKALHIYMYSFSFSLLFRC